uniref:4-coumarate--CoA ligase n=1 Tax=Ananas comosus var. bracteatus TaxID=296719 RepID=A0A6V7NN37_ANACO|nr:unnamed protein product [Ananas comosus var. bracteatus]
MSLIGQSPRFSNNELGVIRDLRTEEEFSLSKVHQEFFCTVSPWRGTIGASRCLNLQLKGYFKIDRLNSASPRDRHRRRRRRSCRRILLSGAVHRPSQRLLRSDEDLPQPPPRLPLPPPSLPLSFPSFAFSLLPPPPLPSHPALVDAANGDAISYPELLSQTRSLAAALRSTVAVSKGDVAFVLSPPRLDVPVLYLALLSLGVVVSPANPVSTSPEISRLVGLSRPSVAFATSSTAHKLPPDLPTILLDSPRFRSFLKADSASVPDVEILQSDTAAIQYSSGTTGQVKAAALPHRSFIAMAAGFHALRPVDGLQVTLLGAPMFHSLGFFFALKGVALAETTVVMTAGRGAAAGVRWRRCCGRRRGTGRRR